VDWFCVDFVHQVLSLRKGLIGLFAWSLYCTCADFRLEGDSRIKGILWLHIVLALASNTAPITLPLFPTLSMKMAPLSDQTQV
jgi:hypothetical protein